MVRWQLDWPKYVALGVGVMVSAFAAAVLAAWVFHFVPLIQLSPGMPPLTRQGALSELLLGLALACLAAGRRRMAVFFATIVIIQAGLVGFEYILSRDFGIDQLLGVDYLHSVSPPGRISPVAAFCYLGAGLALLAMSIRRLARYASAIAGMISSVLIAMSLTMFPTYLLGQNSVYVWGRFRRISIQATVVVVFLGAGIIVLALKESRTRELMPRWLPLALGLGLSASAFGVWQALMFHEESQVPLLSRMILAGGILGALLVAIVVSLSQKAMEGKAAFEKLFEASPDSLVVTDPAGRIVSANGRMASIFGCTRDEIVGTPIETLVPIPLPDLLRIHWDACRERRSNSLDMRKGLELNARRKDGSEFPVEVTLSSLQSGGELQVLAAVRDITERKRAEEELKSLQQRLSLALAAGQMGAWDLDITADRAWRSLEHDRIFGYAELLPTWGAEIFFRHVFPEDLEAVQRAFAEAYQSGRLQFECRITRADNILRWISAEGSVIYNEQHTPVRMLGVVKDITERKHAEEALRESEERFRGIFETSPLGIALIQLDYRLAKVNASLCRMSGYSEAELMALSPFELTHPDDREASRVLAQRLFKGEIRFYQIEKRYVKKSGEIIWTTMTATVIRDPQGRALFGLGMVTDITQRKRAEEELATLSQRLSLAARSASMGVWEWNLRTDMPIWDDRMFEILGIANKAKVTRRDWTSRIHPEDLAAVEERLATAVSGKTQYEVDFRIIRPDGSLRHVSAAGGAVVDKSGKVTSVVGILLDITERKKAHQKLAEQAALLDLAHDAIFVRDLQRRITFWSRGAADTYGWTANEALGRVADELLQTRFPVPVEEFEAHVRMQGGWEGELEHTTRDGRNLQMASRWSLLRDERGEPVATLEINRDITARKQLEEDLEAARVQAIAAARLSALGMMAGGIAHEINNPLSIIDAMAGDLAEMMKDKGSAPPPVVARKSAIIRETVQRIAKIVKSLRQISREGATDTPHPTRLAKILEETLNICQARFKANDVKLLLPQAIPELSVLCREVQIEQALLNLLQNAFDAVAEQGGERWVRLEVGRCDDSVTISIIDNGPGIPPEHRSRIGEPFFTTKEVGKGTGLGLSLSKTIAEEHGGKLEYSEDNGHTRFSLVLPLRRKAEAA